MERLTKKERCWQGEEYWYTAEEPDMEDIENVYNRLAFIEDILGDDYDLDRLRDLVKADREGRYIIMRYAEREGVDRLRELAQADREDRCVVLPVKVGNNIYFTLLGKIIEKQVFSIVTFYNSQRIYCNGTSEFFRPDDIGKTVFLTREAAEEAMKEREKENV